MIWEELKVVLNNQQLRPKVTKLLNIAKAWGNFGIGSGGEMTQYILTKILQLGLPKEQYSFTFWVHCGKWWSRYAQYYQDITTQADILKIQMSSPMSFDTPAQAILQSKNVEKVYGVSIKTSHNLQKKIDGIQTKFKAYSSGPSYCANTFGKYLTQVKDWKQTLRLMRQQIMKRISTDPIKVQFDYDSVKVFKIPIKNIYKTINYLQFVPNPKYDLKQGRFSLCDPSFKKKDKRGKDPSILSALGDRLMIGQSLPKQFIMKDMFEMKLKGESFHEQMMIQFQKFLQ